MIKLDDFFKFKYITTHRHYIKNNISIFSIKEDLDEYSGCKHNYSSNFNEFYESNQPAETPIWYQKTSFSEPEDAAYLNQNWGVELQYNWMPNSVLITDMTRLIGYKDISEITSRMYMTISTFKIVS
ncbi:MAG: hypothetical protein HC836_30305 [Richelia sp. RM2_1_2]|nr:hypothetical protein [Richelia sp. RM2_1_2]